MYVYLLDYIQAPSLQRKELGRNSTALWYQLFRENRILKLFAEK